MCAGHPKIAGEQPEIFAGESKAGVLQRDGDESHWFIDSFKSKAGTDDAEVGGSNHEPVKVQRESGDSQPKPVDSQPSLGEEHPLAGDSQPSTDDGKLRADDLQPKPGKSQRTAGVQQRHSGDS